LEGPENRRTFPLVGLELQTNLMTMKHPKRESPPDPGRRDREAMAVVVSTYEPTEIRFGRFHAPVSGKYRLRFCAYSAWMGPKYDEVSVGRRSEPITVYADTPPRLLRKLGSFDVNPEPTVRELEVWLLAGETIRPDAARFFRSRPPDHKNPLAGPEGMPALAFAWMEVEGPLIDQWPPPGHQLLFGNLPLQKSETRGSSETGASRRERGLQVSWTVRATWTPRLLREQPGASLLGCSLRARFGSDWRSGTTCSRFRCRCRRRRRRTRSRTSA
jgi:hypothetical protein